MSAHTVRPGSRPCRSPHPATWPSPRSRCSPPPAPAPPVPPARTPRRPWWPRLVYVWSAQVGPHGQAM